MKKIISGLVLLTVFIITFLLNYLYPLYADDWVYLMKMPENIPVQNLMDILHTQYLHYFTTGGRIIVHIIAQIQLFIGAPYNDILNSVVYIVFTLLICFIAAGALRSRRFDLSLLLCVSLLLWLFIPTYGVTILNTTTSANYLWGTTIILCFIYPYTVYFRRIDSRDSTSKTVVFFIAGIIAGWTNENMAVAMIFMILVILFMKKIKREEITRWSISGLIGAIIGCAVMLIAPGNYVRYAVEEERLSNTPRYLQSLYNMLGGFYDNALIIVLLYFVVFFLYMYYIRKRSNKSIKNDRDLQLSLLFIITAAVATLAMIASPIFPTRAWFGIIAFIIVGFVILYANINNSGKFYRIMNVFFVKQYYVYYDDLRYIHKITVERNIILEEKRRKV
ncbi:DUF6056 family protein [Dysgonomonas sp. OttesenSCG-928-M03]|nr:DUF6056 family protein [Dysgonomonas sp. OttesenSCG-928-M03]